MEIIALPHREALEAVLGFEYPTFSVDTAVWWAGFSGDPSLRPLLRQIAESYRHEQTTVSKAAFASLAMLGESPRYFIDLAQSLIESPDYADYLTAGDAATALVVFVDSTIADSLRALPPTVDLYGETGLLQETIASDIDYFGSPESFPSKRPTTLREEVTLVVQEYLGNGYGSPLEVAGPGRDRPGMISYNNALDQSTLYALGRLKQLGAAHPDSVRLYLPLAIAADAEQITAHGLSVEGVQAWAMKAALPHEPFPAPPPDATADVVPILECIRDEPDGSLTAFFGYDNRTGAPVSVPYGDANRLVVGTAPPLTRQPSAFAVSRSIEGQPGRTPVWPGFAVAVSFVPGDLVAWTLPGGDATASASSPLCGAPAVPTCAGQPATVYVAADGRINGGPLDGEPYAGRLAGTAGADVIVGTAGPDLLSGAGGDDTLCGGPGTDALLGGPGADSADGGAGVDECAAETATACEAAPTPLARVEPVAECVLPRSGGRYFAYFGYDNLDGRPGQIAYGPDNEVATTPTTQIGTPVVLRKASPDQFAVPGVVPGAPGRTAPYPQAAFRVDASVGEAVTWRLLGQEATLSSSSPVCTP